MEGKEAIINRIIKDAENKADEILQTANAYSQEKKARAEEWSVNYANEQAQALTKDVKDLLDRRKIVANLEAKKITLAAKRKYMTSVNERALEKLCSLDKDTYIKFVEKLLGENAEYGDEIILSSDGVINSSDIKSLEIFAQKNLSINNKYGDFKGGIKLVGAKCDKDLSFNTLIQNVSEGLAAEIAEILF